MFFVSVYVEPAVSFSQASAINKAFIKDLVVALEPKLNSKGKIIITTKNYWKNRFNFYF